MPDTGPAHGGPPRMPDREDWTVPFDDLLREAWGAGCTLCQARRLQWGEIRVLPAVPLAVAITLCADCWRRDPDRVQVDRVLRQRYEHVGDVTHDA